MTTSPVTSPRPPKSTPRARRLPRGARQLVEVLLQNWSTAWGNLDTSDERVFALGMTNHVAILAAFPYNRNKMSEQTSSDAYPIFCGRKAQIFQRLVPLVVADQHFTKSVHRLARTCVLSQPVRSAGKHFSASIPRNPTIVRLTHYVSTGAGLRCKCPASRFIALCRIISTSTRK